MCCSRLAENTGRKKSPKNSPSVHHRTNLSGYIFATKACIDNRKKNLLNSNISSTCSAAEIGLPVWDTPANFNKFRAFASLLHRRRSTEVKQTLHDIWPFPEPVHCIYIFGGCCPLTKFYQLQNSLCVQVFRSPILAALLHALEQWASAKVCGVVQGMELPNFRRRRHLY